jgi:hypothetical protein
MIVGGFDACSDFAQDNIEYVVSDEVPPSKDCLQPVADLQQGASSIQLYEIMSPSGE